MTPEIRFQALTVADADALEALADEVLACDVDVSVATGPESVSAAVRVNVPDSVGTTTVLGHVSMTRCTVLVNGTRGDGLRVGHDLRGAVAAAICDSECERRGPLSARVHALCQDTRGADARRRSERAALVATTAVDEP
jgi:alpha-D-ribose 1-methylphosphonate 5-triphosphate synthase subunit PhnG